MILNRQRTVRVAQAALELFLGRVKQELGLGAAEVTVCLVSDAEIARMNKSFRKKRGPTDVLSFPAVLRRNPLRVPLVARTSRSRGSKRRREKSLGDIAISPATARRNAKKYGRSLPDELRILILHGVLHLLGYDHEADRGQMDRREQRLRLRLGLA